MTKLNFRIVAKSIFILLVAIFPLSYAHEIGHSMVCAAEGHTFQIDVGLGGGSMICNGDVDNYHLFRAAGGYFAMLVAFAPLVAYSWMKRHPYLLIAFLSLGIGHGFNAVIETLFFDMYIAHHELLASVMGFFVFMVFLIFAFKFAKKESVVKNSG